MFSEVFPQLLQRHRCREGRSAAPRLDLEDDAPRDVFCDVKLEGWLGAVMGFRYCVDDTCEISDVAEAWDAPVCCGTSVTCEDEEDRPPRGVFAATSHVASAEVSSVEGARLARRSSRSVDGRSPRWSWRRWLANKDRFSPSLSVGYR